jgi:hypothetical protein
MPAEFSRVTGGASPGTFGNTMVLEALVGEHHNCNQHDSHRVGKLTVKMKPVAE